MIFVSFYRTIKYAFQDFWRNFWLSLVTVSILVLTLLTVNILISFQYLTTTAIHLVEDRFDISVYFKPEVIDSDVLAVKDELSGLQQVSSVELLSREHRVQYFRKQFEDNPEILASIDEIDNNPFGAALIIKAKEPSGYDNIIQVLENERYSPLIEEKDYKDHQKVIDRISHITNRASGVVETMTLVFMIIAVLIVFNTIRVGIYTHREEIGIMKSVGATNWFVRFPYVIESILFGIFACLITFSLWYAWLRFFDPYIIQFFGENISLLSYLEQNLILIFGAQLLGVVVLNMISSSFAIGRYLRV